MQGESDRDREIKCKRESGVRETHTDRYRRRYKERGRQIEEGRGSFFWPYSGFHSNIFSGE